MLNINDSPNNLQIIDEMINFQEIAYVQIPKSSSVDSTTLSAKSALIRNLIDDSFNLELGLHDYGSDKLNIPYVAINNKYYFQGKEKNPLYKMLDSKLDINFKYKLHHSLIDSLKLKNTFVIVFGMDRNEVSPYVHYILSPTFSYQKNYANFGFNQILLLKTIKKVTLTLEPEHQLNFHTSGILKKIKPNLRIDYNLMYLVPEPWSQTKANETLLTIYMNNTDESAFNYDYNFGLGTLQSSFINQKLTTRFVPIFKNDLFSKNWIKYPLIRNFGYGAASLIGKIAINESTMYDYKTKKVIEDYGANSQLGQIIPYNYQGIFSQELNMNLNAIFKNFKIRIFGQISNPLLDTDEGQVELMIENSNQHLKPVWKITFENIKLIRSRLKSPNAKVTSLKGLERMSVKLV